MAQTTVLLVDDHGIVRQGCQAVLTQQSNIAVVGEAATGQEDCNCRRRPRADQQDRATLKP